MYGCIYKITCEVDGKIYIGKTTKSIEDRFKEHIDNSRKNSYRHKSYLYNAIRKYGPEKFSVDLIEECCDESSLNDRERFWIIELNSRDRDVGYNIHEGGKGGKTQTEYICTEEQRRCLSIGWYAPMSEENKKLVSRIHKGKVVSEETRDKLRKDQTGKKASDETRRKMSESRKGKKLPKRSIETREKDREASLNRVHIHKDNVNKNIKRDLLQEYLNDGWSLGYLYNKR